MSLYQRHLRSIYLDPAVDAALTKRAEDEGITKGMLMRRYLREGLCLSTEQGLALEEPPSPQAEPAAAGPHVMRSIYIEDEVDGLLSGRASSEGVHRSVLMRRFMTEGLARPPKPQAVTRLYEIGFLRKIHALFLREAEEAAKRFLERAEGTKQEIVKHLEALRTCSPEDYECLREEFKDFIGDR